MRRSEGRKRRGKRDRSSFGRAVSPAAAGVRGKHAATGTQIARQRRSGLPRKGVRMKLLIASDLHGSAYYCEKLLEAFQREEADRILFLGDILYHGPRNDLPEGYDTKKTAAMLNARKNKIFCVRGNCDTEVDQMVLQFPVLADYAVLQAGDRLIYATHGHVHNMQNVPFLQPGDILLHGHTHVPAWTPFGDHNLYLNPGSLSLPKQNSPHSYMTLEDGVFVYKDLSGGVYHEVRI